MSGESCPFLDIDSRHKYEKKSWTYSILYKKTFFVTYGFWGETCDSDTYFFTYTGAFDVIKRITEIELTVLQ